MAPNILHFVFGMAPDFGGKPFSLAHYLSVKSAVEINKPLAAWFHYHYEPGGEWWQKAKPLLTLNKITAPENFMGRPLYHVAHKADIIRLQVLKETGGVYMDLDTISVKPLTPLLNHSFAIGSEINPGYIPKNQRQKIKQTLRKKFGLLNEENKTHTGLCNAVLIAEPNCDFINTWLEAYSIFRSTGRDKYWNEHSVIIPQQIALQYPDKIATLGPYTFHYPLYTDEGLRQMFEEVHNFPQAYLHHLWESFSWDKYLSQLNAEKIKTIDTTYNMLARKFL